MSRIELAPEAGDDLDRILEHLLQHEVADVPSRIEDIVRAIDVLERNPLIGRPAAGYLLLGTGLNAMGGTPPTFVSTQPTLSSKITRAGPKNFNV